MKKIFFVLLALFGTILSDALPIAAKQKPEGLRIFYRQVVNGQEVRRGASAILEASPGVSVARAERGGQPLLPQTPVEMEIVDFQNRMAYQSARLTGGGAFHIRTPFGEFPQLT